MDFPVGLGFGDGLGGAGDHLGEGGQGGSPGDVVLLVPGGGRQHVVAVQGGVAHAPVDGHHQVKGRQQAFGHLVVGAEAAQDVAAGFEEDARTGSGLGLPALGDGFLHVGIQRALHLRIPFLATAVGVFHAAHVVQPEDGSDGVALLVLLPTEVEHGHLGGVAVPLALQEVRRHGQAQGRERERGRALALGLGQRAHRVHREIGEAHVAGPLASHLACEGKAQDLGTLHLDAVIELGKIGLADAGGRPRLGQRLRQAADGVRVGATDVHRFFRHVLFQMLPQAGEHRRHLELAGHALHLELAFQGGVQLLQGEGGLGGLHRGLGHAVVEIETILGASRFHVGFAQETAAVDMHQQGQVGLLLDELAVVDALLDHHMGHGQAQGRVGGHLHRHPLVGMDRGSRVVRSNGDHLGAVVAGFGHEVGVGDLGVDRVAAPDQDQVGIEQVVRGTAERHLAHRHPDARAVVTDLGVDVQHRGVQHQGGAQHRQAGAAVGLGCALVPDDGAGAVAADHHVDHLVGDVVQSLVPAHPFPATLAARSDPLQGVTQARLVVHALRIAGTLLTATRVVVRDLGVDGLVDPCLLFAPDHAVLDVDVPVAAALVPAIDEVGALGDAVPLPLAPVHILEAGVGHVRKLERCRGLGAAEGSLPLQLHQG